jgi:hypothetical protein
MKDAMQIHIQKLRSRLVTSASVCGSIEYVPLAIFKGINSTLRHGVCEESPNSFAGYGLILTGLLGDLQGGSKMADYALLLREKLKTRRTRGSKTIFLAHGLLFALDETGSVVVQTASGR